MNKILDLNLEFIKNNYNTFFSEIFPCFGNDLKSFIFFEKARRTETYHFYYKQDRETILFNSRINPEKEFNRLLENECQNNENTILLTGFFGGYEAKRVFEKFKYGVKLVYLVFFEDLFFKILQKIDITFLKYCNVDFIFVNDLISMKNKFLINKNLFNNSKFIARKNFLEILSKLKPHLGLINDFFERLNVSKNYKQKFYDIAKKNIEQNKSKIENCKGIFSLQNELLYQNKIGLLLGTGPSVDGVIENIKLYRNEIVLIAVDSALSILNEINIKPDFIISIDPQSVCYDFFKKNYNILSNTKLIFLPYTYYKILNLFENDNLYSAIPERHVIFDEYKGKIRVEKRNILKGGSSVSIYALNFLIYLGLKKIVFSGQDFGFPNKLLYSKNSLYYKTLYTSLSKFKTCETDFYFSFVRDKGINFCGIDTLLNLKNYLFQFEHFLGNKQINFYNLSKIGLDIRNSKKIFSLKELI